MNDATRLRIRRELAGRMGYIVEPVAVEMPGFRGYGLRKPGSDLYMYPSFGSETEYEAWQCVPDPFTDHADCAALVEWLAEQTTFVQERFHSALVAKIAQYGIAPGALEYLTSPLETRVLAACEALGISTEDE